MSIRMNSTCNEVLMVRISQVGCNSAAEALSYGLEQARVVNSKAPAPRSHALLDGAELLGRGENADHRQKRGKGT